MSDQAVIPFWVAPSRLEVEDAHRIAHAVARDGGGDRWQARAAAFDWVTGRQDTGPVTCRADGPSEAIARGEMLVADCVVADCTMAAEMWQRLGVPPAAPATNHRAWCDAVAGVLGWLLGTRRPPIRTPRRNPDGTVMTAAQLYAEKARGRHCLEPEDRAQLRIAADVEADVSRRLAVMASPVPASR